jgi:hypothetical protein
MPRVEPNFASISCYQANESGPRRIFYTVSLIFGESIELTPGLSIRLMPLGNCSPILYSRTTIRRPSSTSTSRRRPMPAPRTLLSHLNGVHVFSTPSATYNASQGHRSRIRRRRRPAVPTPRQSPSLSTTILGVRDGDMSTMPIVPCCGMHRWLPGNINVSFLQLSYIIAYLAPASASPRTAVNLNGVRALQTSRSDRIRMAIATDDDIEDDDDRAPPLRHP